MSEAKRAEPAIMTEIVFPQDTNPLGTMFGGAAYALMDKAAGIAAMRFAGTMAVTASSESVDFSVPIRHGMIVEVIATVIHTGTTSLIVRTELFYEDPLKPGKARATVGYFTMVAVDVDGKPAHLPKLLVETEREQADWELGEEIRERARLRRERHGQR